jgi:hypothetical protein
MRRREQRPPEYIGRSRLAHVAELASVPVRENGAELVAALQAFPGRIDIIRREDGSREVVITPDD